jgi:thiol-disulfide isomerase/thioredoxin
MNLDRTLIARCFGQHPLAAGLLLAGMAIAPAQPLPKNFILHKAPKPIASIAFEDNQGRPRYLAEFRGKVVLLNIWATWCGPCRREMPSLDRLQGLLAGSDFEVVALSIDRAGLEVVRKFYADVGIRKMAIYIDSSGKATRELATVGVPATLLIDRTGRELGRLVGPAEWDEHEIVQFLKRVIAQKTGSVAPTNHLERADGRTAPIAGPSARPGGTA